MPAAAAAGRRPPQLAAAPDAAACRAGPCTVPVCPSTGSASRLRHCDVTVSHVGAWVQAAWSIVADLDSQSDGRV